MTGLESGLSMILLLATTIGAAVYIAAPLRSRQRAVLGPAVDPSPTEGRLERLLDQRRVVARALVDLARDRELGTLTAEDHDQLRAAYERRGSAVAEQLERIAPDLAAREDDSVVVGGQDDLSVSLREGSDRRNSPAEDPAEGEILRSAQDDRDGAVDETAGAAMTATELPSAGAVRYGTREAGRRTTKDTKRATPIALVAGLVAGVFLAGVGAIWFSATQSRAGQRPIATVRAQDYHALSFSPADPHRVFLGTHDGLIASRDGGVTWAPVPGAEGDVMAMVHLPGTILAAGHDAFLRSEDGGATWRSVQSGLPGTDVHALAASPIEPTRLFAAVVGHGLFRSDDGGTTWTLAGARFPPSVVGLVVVALPDGTEALYAATTQEGVLASVDGGRTWATANGFVTGALPTSRVTGIVYDGRSGDVAQSAGGGGFRGALFVATDRGVFRSTDGGGSWTRLALDADVATLALADNPRLILAVDQRGRVFRSTDRGVTW